VPDSGRLAADRPQVRGLTLAWNRIKLASMELSQLSRAEQKRAIGLMSPMEILLANTSHASHV
jgi:hypothetical protein